MHRTDRRFATGWLAAAAFALALGANPARAQDAPDVLVKRVSEEVLQIVKTDPRVQQGDRARIKEVIDTKLAPHFDFERMTALAVGRAWRTATPEQQQQLIEQFKTLLSRTYSNAFVQYREQQITYRPLRLDPSATEATVRTEIARPGGSPVQIDYSMAKKGNEWKAYDVIVGGVSLVTNYRDEFNQQVQSGGVDGLIKSLTAKNAAPSAPPPLLK
jgi:phospholipid transport system substrate-binding protein